MNGKIRQRIKDGYFSAINICKIGNKQFNDFSRLDKSKEYLQILEYQLNKESVKKIILVEVTSW
jgi:KilA-N domain